MQQISRAPRSVSPGEAIIQVQNVSKRFGKPDKAELIVRKLNFEVRPGQIFCLLGPSGSGKSTTMRMLTGVYQPSEGNIRVLGVEPHRFRKYTRAQIGYMPQQFVLFPELTTLENINFVASVYGMNWFGRAKKVRQALEFVDLWSARNRLASNLSGGMQRRLELASTLVHSPKLIFVDEPTAGIDPILRAKFWDHFNALRDEGRTLFVTTQYVTEADYCDVVAILNKGRMLALGSPESIRQEAMGGEIINLTLEEVTSQAVRILRRIPDMRRIKTLSTEDLQLTVANSGEALPEIMNAFQQNDINIQSIEPYHPNFEEVFVQLMEQDDGEEDEEGEEEGARASTEPRRISRPVLPPQQEARPEATVREMPRRETDFVPVPSRPEVPLNLAQGARIYNQEEPIQEHQMQEPPPPAVPVTPRRVAQPVSTEERPEQAVTGENPRPEVTNRPVPSDQEATTQLSGQDFALAAEKEAEVASSGLRQPITRPLHVNSTTPPVRQPEEQI